jgi:hypothetical protein
MAETAGLANAVFLDLVRSPCDLPSFAHLRTKNELADLTSISLGPLEALRRPGSRVAGPASPYARPSDGSRQALPESSRDVASAISGAHRSDAPTGRCSPRAPTQYDRIAWNQLRCSAHRARRFRLLFSPEDDLHSNGVQRVWYPCPGHPATIRVLLRRILRVCSSPQVGRKCICQLEL